VHGITGIPIGTIQDTTRSIMVESTLQIILITMMMNIIEMVSGSIITTKKITPSVRTVFKRQIITTMAITTMHITVEIPTMNTNLQRFPAQEEIVPPINRYRFDYGRLKKDQSKILVFFCYMLVKTLSSIGTI